MNPALAMVIAAMAGATIGNRSYNEKSLPVGGSWRVGSGGTDMGAHNSRMAKKRTVARKIARKSRRANLRNGATS